MKKTPLISIITPAYRSEKYISECIKSVINQDYPYVEHLVLDAGSSDNTKTILIDLVNKHRDRLRVFHKQYQTQTESLNELLKFVRGEIILVLNSDDLLLPDACSWAATNLQKYVQFAVIYGNEYIINENGSIIKKFIPDKYDFNKVLCLELVPPAQASFIKTESFKKVGYCFDHKLQSCADYELLIRLGLKYRIKHISKFVTKFRWHQGSKGQQISKIEEYVIEKKVVMDNLFNDHNTPNSIKLLKKRAYVGLSRWAAEMRRSVIFKNKGQLPLKPLISIITPTYNHGKFLKECIDSVLNQDYPCVEHIIQDGSSTDNTLKLIKPYLQEPYQGRIRFISEQDQGQIDGLNKAIQRANGDILLVLNADDVLMPYACSWAISQFKLFPKVAVIYGDVFIINEKGKIIKIGRGEEYDFVKLFCVELVPPAQAAFIQREYFKKVGWYADTSLDTCPDFEMWVRIGLKFPMKYIPGIVSKYRAYHHLDSRKPRTAKRFYIAKKRVIDRVLNNPKTPPEIKKLRARASQGLSLWAAHEAYDLDDFEGNMTYLIRSAIIYPSYLIFKHLFHVFLDSPLKFIKISINILTKILIVKFHLNVYETGK